MRVIGRKMLTAAWMSIAAAVLMFVLAAAVCEAIPAPPIVPPVIVPTVVICPGWYGDITYEAYEFYPPGGWEFTSTPGEPHACTQQSPCWTAVNAWWLNLGNGDAYITTEACRVLVPAPSPWEVSSDATR